MTKYGEGFLGLSPLFTPSIYYNASGGNVNPLKWSMSCWVRGSDSTVFSGGPFLTVRYSDDGGVRLRHYRGTPGWILATLAPWVSGYDGSDASKEGWHHVGLTMDGSNGTNVYCKLWVDGVNIVNRTIAYDITSLTPTRIELGNFETSAPETPLHYRWLVFWDDLLDTADFEAIYNLGVDSWMWPNRELPSISANITFLASFMHGPDADYATGSNTLTDSGNGDPEAWAWVPIGPDENNIVLDLIGGVPSHDGSDGDPIPPWCALWWDERSDDRPSSCYAAGGWSDIIVSSDDNYLTGLRFDNILPYLLRDSGTSYPTNIWVDAQVHAFIGETYTYNPATEAWEGTGTTETEVGATARSFASLGAAYYKPQRILAGDTEVGTSATQIVLSSAAARGDGYFNGAYVAVVDPNVDCFGEVQQVSSHTGSTLSLAGSFSASPGEGTRVVVYDGGYMLADLTTKDEPIGVVPENKWSGIRRQVGISSVFHWASRGYLRTTGTGWRLVTPSEPAITDGIGVSPTGADAGKDLWQIGIKRLQVSGANRQHTRLKELYDNFLCDASSYHGSPSRRIYRWENVERVWHEPNRAGAQLGDFVEAGSWREQNPWIYTVEWDPNLQCFKGLMRGKDANGNKSYGYMKFVFDETTESWTVSDFPGISNPILTQEEVDEWFSNTHLNKWADGATVCSCHQDPMGNWWFAIFTYANGEDYNDTILVQGDPPWDDLNSIDLNNAVFRDPLRSGGEPLVFPMGHGGMWEDIPNRDSEWYVGRNIFAPPGQGRSYWMAGRAQQHLHNDGEVFQDAQRRLISLETDGGVAFSGYPLGHARQAPMDFNFQLHYPRPVCLSDTIRLVATDFITGLSDGNVGFYWSDCGFYRTWQQSVVEAGSPPESAERYAPVFHGISSDHHLIMYCTGWYDNTDDEDWGTVWWDRGRLASIELSSGQTAGWFCTPVLIKPDGGWKDLKLNVALGDGEVTVAVIDPSNMEQVITGYDHSDCDTVEGGTHSSPHEVTWGGNSLSELNNYDYLRLEFRLTRPTATDTSPAIYEWWAGDVQREYPVVKPASPLASHEGDNRRL